MHKKLILLLLSILLLSACQPTSAPTPAPPATLTHTPSQTAPPTLTPTPTITPTWTPPPALSPEEASQLLLELYETNGGCEMPCWWGITPGETSLGNAFDLLLPIGQVYETSEYKKWLLYYSIGINIPNDIGQISYFTVYLYTPSDSSDPYYGIVTAVSVDDTSAKLYNDYLLADYLGLLGEPDQVYLGVSDTHVFFFLYYVDEALTIFSQHIKNELRIDFDVDFKFLACPQFADIWHWHIWNPHTAVLEDMVDGARSGVFYVPLEEVTDLTIKEFYEIYLNPETDFCVEGQVDIEP